MFGLTTDTVQSDTIKSLLKFITEFGHNIYQNFRNYLYDPGKYYSEFISTIKGNTREIIKGSRTGTISFPGNAYQHVLNSDTRRQFETLLARCILEELAQDKILAGQLAEIYTAAIDSYINEMSNISSPDPKVLSEVIKFLDKNFNALELNNLSLTFEEKDFNSQFIDAFSQLIYDIKTGITKDSYNTLCYVLKLIILTQYIAWSVNSMQSEEIKPKINKVAQISSQYFYHSSYVHRGRGDEFNNYDEKINYRGISYPRNLSNSYSTPPTQFQTFKNIYSPANNFMPTSYPNTTNKMFTNKLSKQEPNPYYISPKKGNKAKGEGDGWLISAIKRHQPYVNSISGLCLAFNSFQIFTNHLALNNPEIRFKVEVLIAATLVYYTGGHSFYEAIKGFKVGATAEGAFDTRNEFLQWKNFCEEKYISNQIIDNTLMLLKTLAE